MRINKTLFNDAIRTIDRSKSRFISIIGIIALGISFFSGMSAAAPNMLDTAAEYYESTNLMDAQVLSTIGMSDEDILSLKGVQGVENVVGEKFVDGILNINGETENDIDGSRLTVRAISFDVNKAIAYTNGEDDPSYMNRIQLIEGDFPRASNQCVVDSSMLSTPEKFQIGASIKIEGDSSDLDDVLATTEYTIVGIIRTPIYTSYDRGNTTIGTGKLGTFFYAPSENFIADYYTSASITFNGTDGLDPYSKEYEDLVASYMPQVELTANSMLTTRAESLMQQYSSEIASSEETFFSEKARVEKELADGQAQVDEVLELANNGDALLNKYKLDYNDKATMAQESIQGNKDEHSTQYANWEQKMQDYSEAKALVAQYSDAEKQVSDASTSFNLANMQVNTQLTTVEYFEKLIVTTRNAISSFDATQDNSVQSMLDRLQSSGLVGVEVDNLMSTINSLTAVGTAEEMAAYLEPQLQSLEQNLADSKSSLNAAKTELETKKIELQEAELLVKKLNEVESQLENAKIQLENAEKELTNAGYDIQIGELEVMTQLSDMQSQISTLETNVTLAKEKAPTIQAEFDETKNAALDELSKAEKSIADAKVQLNNLTSSNWYVYNRDDAARGFDEYGQTAIRTKNLATIFPWFFLIVAALMCLNTMTRMIEEDRTQLGTLKALGYDNSEIIAKYIVYSLLASSVGSIAGTFVGFAIFPVAIDTAYGILFDYPSIAIKYRLSYAIPSILIAILSTVLATFLACKSSLSVNPSTLMRPKPPKIGKRVLLERIPIIWSHLNFTMKVTIRNVFRNKKRFIMAVVGVTGCTALILAGFGLGDAINDSTVKQFTNEDRINQYDMQIVLKNSYDTTVESCDIQDKIASNASISANVMNQIKIYQTTSDNTDKSMETYLSVPEDSTRLSEFVKIQERGKKTQFELTSDGVVITEKLSKELKIGIGDEIIIKRTDGSPDVRATVNFIAENYTFHYIYMTKDLYAILFAENPQYNYITANLTEGFDTNGKSQLAEELMAEPEITAIAYTSEIQSSFQNIMDSLGYLVLILIVSAGMLSFIVLFNLSNININERIREIASIKVLGFNNMEVSNYIFRENAILSAIGTAFGLFVGCFLNLAVINIAEVDVVMFGRGISLSSFIYAALLSAAFTLIVNLVLYKRLKDVNMVESLKSVE